MAVENRTACHLPIESMETRRKVIWMYHVELYVRVRKACLVEGMSVREASRGVRPAQRHRAQDALQPCASGIPQAAPSPASKLEPFTGAIDHILEDDLSLPKKQRHTAKAHLRATA